MCVESSVLSGGDHACTPIAYAYTRGAFSAHCQVRSEGEERG